jgi:hypothetical protein
MNHPPQTPDHNDRYQNSRIMLYYAALALIALIYLMVSRFTPLADDAKTYGLSLDAIRVLQFTIVAPVIMVWFGALYGSLKFKLYAQRILGSPDGRALNWVAWGLIALVFSLAGSSTLQAFEPLMRQNGQEVWWTILSNYMGVLGSLLAFSLIYRGARSLGRLVDDRDVRRGRGVAATVIVPVTALYLVALFSNPYRGSSPNTSVYATYHLSDAAILLTLSLPYILTWALGSLSVVYLYAYYRHAHGIIYRRALSRLGFGLAAVIGASIVIQLVVAIGPTLVSLGLGQILLALYVLVGVYALGHVWIVLGARRLSQIEEII